MQSSPVHPAVREIAQPLVRSVVRGEADDTDAYEELQRRLDFIGGENPDLPRLQRPTKDWFAQEVERLKPRSVRGRMSASDAGEASVDRPVRLTLRSILQLQTEENLWAVTIADDNGLVLASVHASARMVSASWTRCLDAALARATELDRAFDARRSACGVTLSVPICPLLFERSISRHCAGIGVKLVCRPEILRPGTRDITTASQTAR